MIQMDRMIKKMKPSKIDHIFSELFSAKDTLEKIEVSDEVSTWSAAGISESRKKIENCLASIYTNIDQEFAMFLMCKNSPKYFIENFLFLKSVDGKKIPLKLNDIQSDMLKGYHNNNSCRVKVPRQVGSTTLSMAYAFWSMLFHGERIFYAVHREMYISYVSDIFRHFYDGLPDFLKIKITVNTKSKIDFENGGFIKFHSSFSKDGLRGTSVDKVFVQDYQYYDPRNLENLILCITPMRTCGSKVYFFSCKNENFKGTIPACEWVGSYDITDDKSKDTKWMAKTIEVIGWERFQIEYL